MDTMTRFGELVARLMDERGVEGPDQLAAIMQAWGYEVPSEEIVSYMEGTAHVGPGFAPYICHVLWLSDDEERELVRAMMYGQGVFSPTMSDLRAGIGPPR